MWHNNNVPNNRDGCPASSPKPRDATSEAIEPDLHQAAYSFLKDTPMTGTTHANDTTALLVATVAPVAKSKPTTIREFERALRDLGYSQRESASIAKNGFKAVSNVDAEELSELADLIAQNTSLLKDFK